MRNCPSNLSSWRGEVSRASTILLDRVRRVSSSITRYRRIGRDYLGITSLESGGNGEWVVWSRWWDRSGGSQGRRKKHKSNLEDKDVDHSLPDLPCAAANLVFFGDEGYQPDCPWEISGVERAIGDALDEWDFTDSNMEGNLRLNRVSLEGNDNETGDDLLVGVWGRNDKVNLYNMYNNSNS